VTRAAIILLVLLGGCGPSAPACPMLDQTCPAAEPSYATDVAPIIQSKCTPGCHMPGGTEAIRDLTTYSKVFSQRTSVLSQVFDCLMPPAGSPDMTDQERAAVVAWLVCGAQNN
jgi:hypothetical protein